MQKSGQNVSKVAQPLTLRKQCRLYYRLLVIVPQSFLFLVCKSGLCSLKQIKVILLSKPEIYNYEFSREPCP